MQKFHERPDVSATVKQTQPVDPRDVFSEQSGFMGQGGYVGGPIREFGCFCAAV